MKRSLFLAISALALTAASQPLFAAEADTPAPRERAAQRERAPARQAARPAPQRAAPAQTSQSFTGSQAGGFGGGNAGGGGFADPVAFCGQFSSGLGCPSTQYAYDASKKIQATGGGYYSYRIPLFGWAVIGVQGEVAGGKTETSNTFNDVHLTSGGALRTDAQYRSSFSVGTNGSALVQFGVPIMGTGILVYGATGATVARISGSYHYSATSCPALGACPLPTTAAGGLDFTDTRTGVAVAGGVEWSFSPGIMIGVEYRHTSFGSISKNVPLYVTTPGCVGSGCATTVNLQYHNLTTNGVRLKAGLAF